MSRAEEMIKERMRRRGGSQDMPEPDPADWGSPDGPAAGDAGAPHEGRRGRGFGPRGGHRRGRGPGGFPGPWAGPGRGPAPEDFPEDDEDRGAPGPFRGRRGPGRRGPGHGHGGGFGPGGFGPGGFGPGGFGRGGDGPGRGGRRPRGNVRAAVLALLAEEPRQGYHGYAVMTELAQRSGGLWRPSPGSVYPVLQQLQDEGLITAEDVEGGRKVFSVTAAGAETVQSNPGEYAQPWATAGPGQRRRVQTLFEGMGSLGLAAQQVARTGSDEQVERARQALDEARRRIYLILAEDPAASGASDSGASGSAATSKVAGDDAADSPGEGSAATGQEQ